MRTLAICDRWPWPIRSGGQHRLAAMLEALNELGDLEICILSRAPFDGDARVATLAALPAARVVEIPLVVRPQRRVINQWSRTWPWWEPWRKIDFPAIRNSLHATIGHDSFDVVWAYTTLGGPLLDGWGASVRMVDLPELKDVLHRRRAPLRSPNWHLSALKGKYLEAIESHGWRRVQNRTCTQATVVSVCSEIDRKALGCGRVVVVPNGYKISGEPLEWPDMAGLPRTLLFQGRMAYYPNSDAAVFFARDVFPLVRQRIPEAQFRVVGKAGPEVLGLSSLEGVVVVGEVERIECELSKALAVVVPLRIGTGTRLKILEAWANGIPVVSTTVGAEGLPVSQAENVLLADSAAAMAEACIRVLTDEPLRTRLAEAGRRTLESRSDTADIQARLLATIRAEVEAQREAGSAPRSTSNRN